jgi:5-formyltetrahydrofolate cyclo-ligase
MIAEEKRRLRALVKSRLAGVTPESRARSATDLIALLLLRPEWKRARTVMGYLSLADELDVSPVLSDALAHAKKVALPRYLPARGVYGAAEFRGEGLIPKQFGIREPSMDAPEVPLKQLDFVLVPGVAFDRSGKRLGRGKGFYDRLLAEVSGAKCGVALDDQILDQLPFEPHDIIMDFIVTPTRWIDVRSGVS